MAVFVNDTFTDTNGVLLQSHTGETGATWTEHPDVSGTDATIQSNKASSLSTSGSAYYASGAPATAEYDVELTTGALSSATNGMGPQGRLLTTPYTGYLAWAAGALYLYKTVAGAFTELGTYAGAVASGTVVKLQIRDASKKVFLDGVERISSTNNDVTGAGKAGVRFYSDGAIAAIVDTFSATDAGGATAINATPANATASGVAANLNVAIGINATAANATASGVAANVSLGTVVNTTPANATASGVAASLNVATGINATPANATASGVAADVANDSGTNVNVTPANATASGVAASLNVATGINATVADATAQGTTASVSDGLEVAVEREEISYAPSKKKTRAPNFAPRREPEKAKVKAKPKAKQKAGPGPSINRLRVVNDLIPPDSMFALMQKRKQQVIEQQEINRLYMYNIRARAALLAA